MALSLSEKTTDMIVFSLLRACDYVDGGFVSIDPKVNVWAQTCTDPRISACLSAASKRKTGNGGFPEYLILDTVRNLVVVFEHKAETKKHVYRENIGERVDEYAVNGALWYTAHLKDAFDVVAVAVSGTNSAELLIDTYAWRKHADTFTNLNVHEVCDIECYRTLVAPSSRNIHTTGELSYLTHQAKVLNSFLRDYMGVHENSRLYVLGATLAALEDPGFKMSYSFYNDDESLSEYLYQTIYRRLKPSNIYNFGEVVDTLKPALCGLANSSKEEAKRSYPNGVLLELVHRVDNLLFEYWQNSEVDLISVFFNVFLSYSTSGGSDLGIVLTPSHVTKLFSDIAEVDINSKVIDICAGTGGFLTAAWKRILLNDSYSAEEKDQFRRNNLLGVEKEPSIYTVLALNMFLHKDGKTRIYNTDCFSGKALDIKPFPDKAIKGWVEDFEGNVGFVNPPYSDELYPELEFVELLLDVLMPSSIAVAIIPVNSVSSQSKKHSNLTAVKKRILDRHTLVASIQMPQQLFYPKGVETVVLVFKTGAKNSTDTWMAKFNDGYELVKHQKTPTPTYASNELYAEFITAYRDKRCCDFAFKKPMTENDQWIYLLHKPFEYEIKMNALQDKVNHYLAYLVSNRYPVVGKGVMPGPVQETTFEYRAITELFDLVTHQDIDKICTNVSSLRDTKSVPFIGRSKANNGVTDYVVSEDCLVNQPGILSVALDGSTGSTFYQHHAFVTGQNIHLLAPRSVFPHFKPLVALYVSVSMQEAFSEYTWNIGLTKKRLMAIKVKVPVCDGHIDVEYIERVMGQLRNADLVAEVADARYAE